MIRNLAEKIGHSLIHGGMPEENFEIYAYGAECFLNLFISEILLLTFGLFTHRLPEILLWDISFMLLRRQIGGYHAHSHFSCIICSTAIGSFSLLLNTFWKYIPAFGYFCLILLLPFIVRHSPVLHPNHPVTKELKNSARKKGILLFFTETIVSLLFFLFYPPFAYPIISGIFSAEILCILGYYKNFSH